MPAAPASVLTFASVLYAHRSRIWRAITDFDSINDELRPFATMQAPPGLQRLDGLAFVPGRPLGRVTLMLAGLVPVGRMELTLASLAVGEGFVEQSSVSGLRSWRHERSIEPHPRGTSLVDRLTVEPRIAPAVTCLLVDQLFRHRHRRLRNRWGGVAVER